MDALLQTKFGGFAFVLAVAFGGAALLYFGGKWFVVRFSDPKWLKKYMPLFAFMFVTLRTSKLLLRLMQYFRADNRTYEVGFFAMLGFIAACILAWRRYLIAHPDGPPEAPPASNPNSPKAKA